MLTEQLIGDLAQKMEKATPSASPYQIFLKWTACAAVYILLLLLYMGTRADFAAKLHSPLFDAELLALAGVIITSLLSAAILAFPDMYQKKHIAWLPVPAFLLFAVVLAVEWVADHPPAPPPAHELECLVCITLLSLVPGAFILYNIRKFASTRYYLAGMVAALAAFSIGAFALRIAEQTDSISHLLQWHYLPMIGAALIGLLIGKLCLKW
jgi:hypothetical protein